MVKLRYAFLAVAVCVVVFLSSCVGEILTAENPPTPTAQVNHRGDSSKVKININSAILSELDKFEAKLGVPALSNKIQANRPYGSPADLVTKKVITQAQFEQIQDMVTVEDIVLTGEAKDVDYMTKLGLMQGHLLVAQELLDQNQPKQAEPHIGHPVEEIYVDIEEQLNERNVKEFKSSLIKLSDLIKSQPKDSQVKVNLVTSIKAVDEAIAALPSPARSKPAFVLQVINGLLDAAKAEYGAAVTNGKISADIEYQDSRGFVVYANELYKSISSQVAQTHPHAHQAINLSLTELLTVWPAVKPPAQVIKTPEDVAKLVKTVEENSQKVITTTNTQAQI